MWWTARVARAGPRLGLAFLLALQGTLLAQNAPADCRDLQNRPVRVTTDRTISHPAEATLDNSGQPLIYWNPNLSNGRSESWRRFSLLHECGHILLHHVDRMTGTVEDRRRQEQDADCFAFQTLVDSRETNGSRLDKFRDEILMSSGDLMHLGGEERLASLDQCLQERDDQHRWRAALDRLLLASRDSFGAITGPWRGESWSGTVHEATLLLPGTFDCEIRPPRAFVCLMMAADEEQASHRRFQAIRHLIGEWLPADWTSSDHPFQATSYAELFVAQSGSDGTFIALARTRGSRVYFVARPYSMTSLAARLPH
ncbi:MAG TPA: ImmA/IrrE family metallo-endopeptidase [Gemmatimonadales bacterium]|nr:ImmA/IrrE family metallo-endopeptidase [Gemmatimonadales bacterium]